MRKEEALTSTKEEDLFREPLFLLLAMKDMMNLLLIFFLSLLFPLPCQMEEVGLSSSPLLSSPYFFLIEFYLNLDLGITPFVTAWIKGHTAIMNLLSTHSYFLFSFPFSLSPSSI